MNNKLINEFTIYLLHEKGASENTIQSYERDLKQFSKYIDIPLQYVQSSHLTEFLQNQKNSGRSDATIARNIASLRAFYTYLFSNNLLSDNPAAFLAARRIKQKAPLILTSDEVELLLEQPRCVDLKGYRDKAMLEVLCSTGIRVSELINLKTSDVDLNNGTIICRSKNKNRVIQLYPPAIKALGEYLKFIRKHMIRDLYDETLFVNVNGAAMTRQGFWKILKSYQIKAGIEKNITPHTLRHSFAAHLLHKGQDIYTIQQIMGHSDISSTQVYSQIEEIS